MRLLLALAVLLTLATARAEVFGPGETARYDVSWLGLKAGEATMSVGQATVRDGQTLWPYVCLARTASVASVYPIDDRFVTYWNPSLDTTPGSEFFANENSKRRRERVTLDRVEGVASVVRQKEGHGPVQTQYPLQADALDVAATLLKLRESPFTVGEVRTVAVFTGDRSFDAQVVVESLMRLQTALGDKDVFKVRISSQFNGKLATSNDLRVYFSADRYQIPLRVEADFVLGPVVATLVSFAPGL